MDGRAGLPGATWQYTGGPHREFETVRQFVSFLFFVLHSCPVRLAAVYFSIYRMVISGFSLLITGWSSLIDV
jgi:hypothetical protein